MGSVRHAIRQHRSLKLASIHSQQQQQQQQQQHLLLVTVFPFGRLSSIHANGPALLLYSSVAVLPATSGVGATLHQVLLSGSSLTLRLFMPPSRSHTKPFFRSADVKRLSHMQQWVNRACVLYTRGDAWCVKSWPVEWDMQSVGACICAALTQPLFGSVGVHRACLKQAQDQVVRDQGKVHAHSVSSH
jgi:hypothetical protein